jgi:hypothetical protein
MFEVSTTDEHGDQRCRHDLCRSHVVLASFPMVKRFQAVVTYTIDREIARMWSSMGGLLVQG